MCSKLLLLPQIAWVGCKRCLKKFINWNLGILCLKIMASGTWHPPCALIGHGGSPEKPRALQLRSSPESWQESSGWSWIDKLIGLSNKVGTSVSNISQHTGHSNWGYQCAWGLSTRTHAAAAGGLLPALRLVLGSRAAVYTHCSQRLQFDFLHSYTA